MSQHALPRLSFIARKHLSRLGQQIGRQQALREVKWIVDDCRKNRFTGPGTLHSRLTELLKRRTRGEPLQYVLGTQPFGSLELYVAPPTLIPRPETEEWSLWLAEELRADLRCSLRQNVSSATDDMPSMTALDLCTGSGCIPLLLASELPRGTFRSLGIDVSSSAIALAKKNQENVLGLSRPISSTSNANTFEAIQLDIFSSSFLSTLQSHPLYPFDLITSNPPYITRKDYAALPASVKKFEDHLALVGDPPSITSLRASTTSTGQEGEEDTGLAFYTRIATLLNADPLLLKPGGRIVMEVGSVGGQAGDVLEILEEALGERIHDIGVKKDASGLERVVWARLKA